MNEIRDRVLRGAAWLDEQRPGWESRIDLSRLDLSQRDRCVLGQLDGWYTATAYGGHHWAEGHGFDAVFFAGPFGFAELTDAWTDLIEERRSSA